MKHLGDITKISGYEAPVVDCVIGGSPCQDLSVAGKRAGLAGARSGLYMEQIRIIKEMREADVLRGKTDADIRPRYMVWENVPGAFSSNGGKDFAAVLEEAIRAAEPQAPAVCVPKKGWPTSGCFWDELGRWSVAWRVLDAQFWGTSDKPLPQRRRRIALVADFGGLSAPEILFVRKSMSGNIEPGEPKGKETAGDLERSVGEASLCIPINDKATQFSGGGATRRNDGVGNGLGVGANGGPSPTLTAGDRHAVCAFSYKAGAKAQGIGFAEETSPTLSAERRDAAIVIENHPQDSRVKLSEDNVVQTLSGKMGTGGGNVPMVMELLANETFEMRSFGEYARGGASTVKARDYKDSTDLVVAGNRYVVRRLTPLECERLQGFPDGWTDIGEWADSKGKVHKPADSPRYKALGNSIALPPWKWVLKRLCACYERDATMASLFDGIGGFPYIWEQLNGKGSCLWASEVEEFCIAVTKKRFGD